MRWSLTRARRGAAALGGHADRHSHRLPRAERAARRRRRRTRRPAARLDRDTGRAGAGCRDEPSTSRTSRAAARSFGATHSRAPCAGGARPTSCHSRSNGRTTGGSSPSRRRRASSCSTPTAASCARSARWARPLVTSAFRPHSHQLAVSVRLASRSEVKLVDIDHPGRARLRFAGPGTFGDVVWSPDGTTLLVDWPTANQWVFLRGCEGARGREHPRGVPTR